MDESFSRDISVITAIDGPTELIPINSSPAFRAMHILI